MHPRKCAAGLPLVVIELQFIIGQFTHILQGYFTGTGAIYDCPSAKGATLKNVGKLTIH